MPNVSLNCYVGQCKMLQCTPIQLGSLFILLMFSFCCWFPLLCKTFWFYIVPFLYFHFCWHCLSRQFQKILLRLVSKGFTAYVFFYEFYVLGGLTFKRNPFWVYFSIWYLKVPFSFFYIFSFPSTTYWRDSIFLLYILASFICT